MTLTRRITAAVLAFMVAAALGVSLFRQAPTVAADHHAGDEIAGRFSN